MPLHNDDVLVTDQHNAGEVVDRLPHLQNKVSNDESTVDEKNEKTGADEETDEYEADEKYLDDEGKEKVLQTAEDFSTRLISLDDDPTMPVHTFRTWFTGLGLSAFGAVLGMLFQFRPQVILVSALFLQLLAYMIGKFLEKIIPGPGTRFNNGNAFWRFMNPGPFNLKEHVAAQIMANTVRLLNVH